MPKRIFVKEKLFEVSLDRLWNALTQTEELRCWMGPDASIDFQVGNRLRIGPQGDGTIQEIVPGSHFVVQWHYYGPEQPVLCRFLCEQVAFSTRLTIVEEGFTPDEIGAWCFGGAEAGWESWLLHLQRYMENQIVRRPDASYGLLTAQLGLRDASGRGSGLYVRSLKPGSLAERGGLKQGDELVTWNGNSLQEPTDYWRLLWQSRPGQQIELSVRREGKPVFLTIELADPAA